MKAVRLGVVAASIGLVALATSGSSHAELFYSQSGDFSPGGTMTYEFTCSIPVEADESVAFIGITEPNSLQIEDAVLDPSGPVSLSITIPAYLGLGSVVEITGGCKWRIPATTDDEAFIDSDLFVVDGQLVPIGGFTSDPVSTESDSTDSDSTAPASDPTNTAAAGGGAPGGDRLPETGSMTTTVAVLAGVLLASGAAMVATRRRAHTS